MMTKLRLFTPTLCFIYSIHVIDDGRLSDKHTHVHSVSTSEEFILQMLLSLAPAVVTGVRPSGDGLAVTGQVSGDESVSAAQR